MLAKLYIIRTFKRKFYMKIKILGEILLILNDVLIG